MPVSNRKADVSHRTMSAKTQQLPDASGRVARTRKRIHDAARHAFSEQGLAVQIDDVIHIAGISRGTFYNYFRTVENLFEHVAAEMAGDMGERIYSRSRIWRTSPFASPMVFAISAYAPTGSATGASSSPTSGSPPKRCKRRSAKRRCATSKAASPAAASACGLTKRKARWR